jgi:cell division protein FtsN
VVKPNFDFYKVLPEDNNTPPPPPAPVAQPTPTPPPPAAKDKVFLQLAAFENPAEADNLKARLALMGMESSSQRAQLADGRVVYRVRVGPFSGPEEMLPIRERLSSAGFTPTVARNP